MSVTETNAEVWERWKREIAAEPAFPFPLAIITDPQVAPGEWYIINHGRTGPWSDHDSHMLTQIALDNLRKETAMPDDSTTRKNTPLATGVIDYFPDALKLVAQVSKAGNDKHNPGQPLHWSKDKSNDHADCIARHLIDRGKVDPDDGLTHTAHLAWRALALLQTELEVSKTPVMDRIRKVGLTPKEAASIEPRPVVTTIKGVRYHVVAWRVPKPTDHYVSKGGHVYEGTVGTAPGTWGGCRKIVVPVPLASEDIYTDGCLEASVQAHVGAEFEAKSYDLGSGSQLWRIVCIGRAGPGDLVLRKGRYDQRVQKVGRTHMAVTGGNGDYAIVKPV